MKTLKIGDQVGLGTMSVWALVERTENFGLFENDQQLFSCANIVTEGGREVAHPVAFDAGPHSIFRDRAKVKLHFDNEVLKLAALSKKKIEEAEYKRLQAIQGEKWRAMIKEGEQLKGPLLQQLRQFVADSKSLSELVKNKEVSKILTEIEAINTILKYGR